ncbi:MAG TPA: GNAT family N-acetyltransferase [Gammaproteobacteria bacterium]|nr:GNAT family N-acetyltransferase [Gammaproteobacteria bacterium]
MSATPARALLEPPTMARAASFLAAVARSRGLHGRWTSPPASREQYRAFVVRVRKPNHVSRLVCTEHGELAGVITISEIVKGSFCSGYLGYYALVPHAGRGYMRAGLGAMIRLAFKEHGLHRLEANIQPDNRRSIELVRGLGFAREGFSPRYLKIRGRWRDHERWALTLEDWKASARSGT